MGQRRKFPLRLFLLLKQPCRSHEFTRLPGCALGTWARNLRADFPDLSITRCMTLFAETAVNVAMDTSVLESRRASVRRLVNSVSFQTHMQSACALSTRWLLMLYRRIHASARSSKLEKPAQRRERAVIH